MPRDAVIIGAGHNGLVAAALLGRAGLKPLVLVRDRMPANRAKQTLLLLRLVLHARADLLLLRKRALSIEQQQAGVHELHTIP